MKQILAYLGIIIMLATSVKVIPIITALIYGEDLKLVVLSTLVSLLTGLILYSVFREKDPMTTPRAVNFSEGMILTTLSFIAASVLSIVPYYKAFHGNVLNALFESVSGFTTTGFTMLEKLDSLPRNLLMWRATTLWVGGVGVVVVFVFIVSLIQKHQISLTSDNRGSTSSVLFYASGFTEKLENTFAKTVLSVLKIYIGFTLLGIGLLYLTGLSLFEAITISMSAISTGGFSTTDTFYSNPWQLTVISLLMLVGMISFIVHNQILRGKISALFTAIETRVYVMFFIFTTVIGYVAFPHLKIVLFELINYSSTTGFTMTDARLLPPIFVMLLIFGMVIGGSAVSTAGGLKLGRLYVVISSMRWTVKKMLHPDSAIIPLRIQGKPMEEKTLINILIFCATYVTLLLISLFLFMLYGYGFFDSIYQVVSGLGTAGVQSINLVMLPAVLKWLLMILMLLGRLEIFPFLVLVAVLFRKR